MKSNAKWHVVTSNELPSYTDEDRKKMKKLDKILENMKYDKPKLSNKDKKGDET